MNDFIKTVALLTLMFTAVVFFFAWLPSYSEDRFEEQNIVCYSDKEAGFEQYVKTCYKLTPIK